MAKKNAKVVVTNPKASLLSGGLPNGPAPVVGTVKPEPVQVLAHTNASLNKAARVPKQERVKPSL